MYEFGGGRRKHAVPNTAHLFGLGQPGECLAACSGTRASAFPEAGRLPCARGLLGLGTTSLTPPPLERAELSQPHTGEWPYF